MDDLTKRLSRRDLLKVGAGLVGGWVALKAGALPALAQGGAAPVLDGPAPDPATPPDDGPMPDDHDNDEQWERVEAAMGHTEGRVEPDDVFKFDLSRTDIHATIQGVVVKPDFALDTEINFLHPGSNSTVKWEFVLLGSEVNLVLDALFTANLGPANEVFTALHNHYIGDEPKIYFLHGFAHGNAVDMARSLYRVLSRNTGTPFGHGNEPPGNPGFDWQQVAHILGGSPELSNGILTVSVERKEHPVERGIRLPPSMQFESMFNFQSIGNGQVAMIGEYAVLKDEADPVARTLRHRNIQVTAQHNHELDVQPQFYYVHCWATGSPTGIAHDLRAALNLTNSKFE